MEAWGSAMEDGGEAEFDATPYNDNIKVDCMISSITKSLKKGEDVTLVGFGTFKVVKKKPAKDAIR
jgi:nucleoid DNA-binding protein